MPENTLRLATFNANSIRVRLPQILVWIDENEADLLCIQETKVQDKDFPAKPIHAAGYEVVFQGQKAHAGVAIISRGRVEDVALSFGDGEEEQPRLIRCRYRGISVVNTYVPQGRDVESEHFAFKLRWFERVRSLLEREYDPNDPLVWLGDLNVAPEPIDVHDPKRLANHVDYHPDARAALAKVMDWGLVDVFRRHHPDEPEQYSYYDYRVRNPVQNKVGWRVDHILATEALAERSIRCWIDLQARLAQRPSDHTFVAADFEL